MFKATFGFSTNNQKQANLLEKVQSALVEADAGGNSVDRDY
jgi:hypothetical protein